MWYSPPSRPLINSRVRAYRTDIGTLVNRIKHNQGRLRFLSARMHHKPDLWWSGYFVEGALATGVGPDATIHSARSGAFSFNRDLRYHLCELLFTSDALAQAVRGLTSGASSQGESGAGTKVLVSLIEAVAALTETYFPDEYEKPRPVLELTEAPAGAAAYGR